jgi:hypothetical protein
MSSTLPKSGSVPSAGADSLEAGSTAFDDRLQPPMTGNPTDWRQFSHELRTPLNAILGNVELLLDGSAGPLPADARACLGEVQVASRELAKQVQILLLWSEARAREPSCGGTTLDLIAVIRDLPATELGGAPEIVPPDARLMVNGDPFWLQTLIKEIIELSRTSRAAQGPMIRLESNVEGTSLDFSWRHFRVPVAKPSQIALIVAIAELQGAAAVLTQKGLCLYWPTPELAEGSAPADAPVAPEVDQAN